MAPMSPLNTPTFFCLHIYCLRVSKDLDPQFARFSLVLGNIRLSIFHAQSILAKSWTPCLIQAML
jgi:hypothetical protein